MLHITHLALFLSFMILGAYSTTDIIRLLKDNTHDAYIVGGCVRDTLLGRIPGDWDITTSAHPEKIKQLFRRTIDTGIEHGTVTVRMHGESYEVTTYRVDGEYSDHRRPDSVVFTDNLVEDLKRRDFTINAMAIALNGEQKYELIDPFDGIGDIKRKIMRTPCDPDKTFSDDPLRMMRAVRFATQLNFDIYPETFEAIQRNAYRLEIISSERIVEELNLDDATAARFTTVYSQYVQEMHAAYKQHAMIRPQKGEDGKKVRLTDEQVKHNLEEQLALSQTIIDLRKKYYKEYLKFLTPRQIEKLGKMEKKQAGNVQKTWGKRQASPQVRPGHRPMGKSVMPPRQEKK